MSANPPAEDVIDIAVSRACALLEAAPDMVQMLRRYASECAECGGGGEVVRGDGNPENDHSEPCGACEEIWDLIERATPTYLYRDPTPAKAAVEEPEDDIAF